MLYLSGMKKLEQILSYHIDGGAGAYKKLYDDIEAYTKECVKASLEKVSENVELIETIKDSAIYDKIDKESITSEENIILL